MSLLLVAGGGPSPIHYGLSCDAGAYAYTGQAATFVFGRGLLLSAGAYVYTGQAASLEIGRKLALDAGAYSYQGNDAVLDYVPGSGAIHYALGLETGLYVYEGNSAQLDYAPGVVPVNRGAFYGVSFRRKRKEENTELREALEALVTTGKLPVQISVKTSPVGESEELVELKISGVSKRDMDAIIAVILASEL